MPGGPTKTWRTPKGPHSSLGQLAGEADTTAEGNQRKAEDTPYEPCALHNLPDLNFNIAEFAFVSQMKKKELQGE